MSRLRANQITNENANGAPNFPHGITVTGIVTASTASTTMDQIVVGSAVTANSQGIDVTGIVTATSFKGDGSNLTGIDSSALSSGGSVKVQANSHGAVTTGVMTATSFVGNGAGLTGIQGIPTGVIMMWSGTIATIPSGFALCDGSNNTPDLRDKFIVGAKQDDGVGAASTAKSNITGSLAATGGSTSATTSQEGVHEFTGSEDNSAQVQDASSSYNGIVNKNSRDRHQHGIDWRHTHTVPTVPPYYVLAFIMKT